VRTFRCHGYAGASLDVLTRATGLRRGSLYAAFPDKRSLFLAALAEYTQSTVGLVERTLATAEDPVVGIEGVLRRVARAATAGEGRYGCLLTNTAAELGGRDTAIQVVVAAAFKRLEAAYEGALVRAKAEGCLGAAVDPGGLARLLVAVMHGLRVLGTSGASEAELQQVVDGALRALGRSS
jgi:TetR/AcrR family transcriptional repressor of nem operon